ncbi:MAG: hypothetical protein GZ090_01370 [Oxalobacteraceae bacterium]|nr:hypothetical protein [Oxalobacteraceae bacterium]
MTFSISQALNDARLTGTLSYLDTGVDQAKIQLFDTVRPANGAAAGAEPLVELLLDKPCGAVDAGVLTLTPGAEAMILTTGLALWARVLNGNGEFAIDGDISDTGGTGDFTFPTPQLYAGGITRLVSGVLR